MTAADDHHGDLVPISCLDRVGIPDGTSRLDDGGDNGSSRDLHRVGHGEEGIGCQNFAPCLFSRLLQGDLAAPTRFICPAPPPKVISLVQPTMAVDFTC